MMAPAALRHIPRPACGYYAGHRRQPATVSLNGAQLARLREHWMILPFQDDQLAERIRECVVELLVERGAGRSICPSEAAHLLGARLGWRWQDLMRPVRTVATALVESGLLEAIQHESVVDIRQVRGPVRLRLRTLPGVRSVA